MPGVKGNHMAGDVFAHQLAYKLQAAAVKAAGATSWASCHQPKEPKALKELKK